MDVFAENNVTLTSLLIVSVLAYLVYLLVQFGFYIHKLNVNFGNVPGPKKHWLYGNLHLLPIGAEERLQFALKNSTAHPRYYCFWAGSLKPMITVTHPNTVRAVLRTAVFKFLLGKQINPNYTLISITNGSKTSLSIIIQKLLLPKTDSHDRILFGTGLCNTYKRYFGWWNTSMKCFVTVCHPETVRMAMKTAEPKPIGFGGMYRFGLPWLGEGLLIAGGQKWARSRRLLTPAFHFDILKPYIGVYNDAADQLSNNLMRYAEKKERFEVFEYVSKSTLDVILRCAFSYITDCQKESGVKHPYVKAVEQIADMWNFRARKPWLYPDFVFYMTKSGREFSKNCDYVHGIAEDIIQKRKAALEKNGQQTDRKYLDFLDILLTARDESGQGLTPLEIRNEVDTFLFEGHDTTASAISWILYSLAEHPEYQQKCQEEIDSILQDRDSDDIEWSDLSRLEYLTMCIKEGMRHHSPVPFIQREFTHDFEIDGRKFPAGTSVSLHIFGLHHNATVWENPMEYIPERFSKENVSKMDSFQFVPFSAGPRNCIGQHFAMNEEKVVIGKLLRRFSFKLDTTHNVRRKVGAVMRAENGIYMYATPRSK